jgi:hypothetical protein
VYRWDELSLETCLFVLTAPIDRMVELFSPHEWAKYFAAAGYDAT